MTAFIDLLESFYLSLYLDLNYIPRWLTAERFVFFMVSLTFMVMAYSVISLLFIPLKRLAGR